jgi:tripartite-type tricarboxylate transporter receptor subunit TctC
MTAPVTAPVTTTAAVLSPTLLALATLLASNAAAQPAADAAWPARPVRLVVPYAPGGGLDILARLLAPRLTERWGQNVLVDNRPGASGQLGTQIVANAAPDGYTLVIISTEHITAPMVYRRQLYDPVASFVPIVQTGAQSYLLVVNAGVAATSVKELVALARTRKLNYTSAGTGSVGHLSGELFKSMAGIEMTHVPYKGTGPALGDTVSGQVQVMVVNPLPAMPHIKSGRLRLLAVTDSRRIASLPEVPTIAEAGIPGFNTTGWNGLLAPAGTPRAVVSRINETVVSIVRAPDLRDRMTSEGTEPIGSTPEAFRALMVSDQKRWAAVVSKMKIDAD